MATTQHFVKPARLLVPRTIRLSILDQYTIRIYAPSLIFFELGNFRSLDEISSEIQQGLATLLVEIPFLAGDLLFEDEERNQLKIEIPEEAGVLFKTRDFTRTEEWRNLDFELLKKGLFPPTTLDTTLLGPVPIPHISEKQRPCLALQANFVRGGLILAIYLSHTVADGIAEAAVIKRLSQHVSAVSGEYKLFPADMTTAAALDRDALLWGTLQESDFSISPEYLDLQISSERHTSTWRAPAKQKNAAGGSSPKPSVMSIWHISSEKLRELQEKAKPPAATDNPVAESSVLAAFIWQHYSRARNLEYHKGAKLSLLVPTDIRPRVDPQLHPTYLGNAIVQSITKLPPDDLLSSEPDNLYKIASAIANSVDAWSSKKIWKQLAERENRPKVTNMLEFSSETDLEFTSMAAVPSYSLHWGPSLGNACSFRLPGLVLVNGWVALFPRLPDGSLEVCILQDIDAFERLKSDVEFTRFADFMCR